MYGWMYIHIFSRLHIHTNYLTSPHLTSPHLTKPNQTKPPSPFFIRKSVGSTPSTPSINSNLGFHSTFHLMRGDREYNIAYQSLTSMQIQIQIHTHMHNHCTFRPSMQEHTYTIPIKANKSTSETV
ncbi:hypothetical protein EYC84_003499 [Monilinia fructicola]|uniref:Uncharacterized protein n=1 Tax=Monilinia fructicola TaxID=38448 RepID=A0A5M9JXR4_MONFR|nr:hypothetical protein EYC84_003499 [Monilinia fructicola]